MIYLFDDKINRQKDYGWDKERFAEFSNLINPIYLYSEIKNNSDRETIFSNGNLILFHESFFDNEINVHKDAAQIRTKLNRAQENKDFQVVYFSGSKSSRKFDENIGHIPVSILYQNLDVFLKNAHLGKQDLRYLFFGENYKLEEFLENELVIANKNIEDSIENESPDCKNFIALTLKNEIETLFENAKYETFFLDKEYNFDITDEYLSNKINDWFTIEEYDNIFIPLCFGPVLSDYNGLRFALHIRCTDTLNQFKNIFLYSFVDYSQVVENKYFDILRTKNIKLIPYRKIAFVNSSQLNLTPLKSEELRREIKKVKLDPPGNYEDNHSIANEWAIHRWASALNANDDEIEMVTNKVQHHLYFKYLKTIYPVQDIPPISESDLEIKYSGNPKILYIDDEADKGWYEIFCKVLCDENKLDLHYLDGELNYLTREEIIEISLDKIKAEDIDIVLLDFRLHPDDFAALNLEEVTGLRLLNQIKDFNSGIQVIIFSATNKIWNFKALQEAGADGFIIKEGPETSSDKNFTIQAITSLINSFNIALERVFLKKFFELCRTIQVQLRITETEDDTPFADFIQDLKGHIKIIISAGKQIKLEESTTLDIVFLNGYNFLEKFKNFYLNDGDYQPTLGIDEVEINRYSFYKNKIQNEGQFIRNDKRDKPSWFQCLCGIFIDYFSLATINDKKVKNLYKVKEGRNSYIHNNKKQFDKHEILMIMDLCVSITSNLKE
ncbi:response regulator [Antarcticibacterium arcticum]|uniref:Response regulator n=1 Tax=Antarcticibacterium arcticum TaxID=2585771 RepID=A0A5B8YJZ3_9FLAO|nr:response regulator [Antarcticibacterium arcticum]QED36696.1 response regulator [Antarcticibacterium arcticum]